MKRTFILLGCLILVALTSVKAQIAAGTSYKLSVETVHSQRKAFHAAAEKYFTSVMEGQEQRISTAINGAAGYLDFFACQDYSSMPEWEKPILDLVRKGQFDQAIELYDKQELLDRYEDKSPLLPSLERYVLLLEMTGTRANAVRGMDILRGVAEKSETSIKPMYHLINLAVDLRFNSVAEEYLQVFQERSANRPSRLAEVLLMRAWYLARRNRPNEALGFGRRSLVLFDSLMKANDDPKIELINRARLHRVLARIYSRLDEQSLSIEHIRACKECYELEAADGNGTFHTERVRALYAVAPMAADQNAFFLADSIYTQLDKIGTWLLSGSEYQASQFQFNSLRLRGLSCYRIGKYDDSQFYFDQAKEMLDKMENLSPGQNLQFRTDLAFNYASLYYQRGDLFKALECDREVLAMVLEDKEHDAHRHANDLCYCYKYIGNCLWAIGWKTYLESGKRKTKEVMKYYREAFDCYATALHYNPRDAESMSKYNLGDLILSGMEKPMAMPKNF